ncbi:MAG: hypothetical protein K8S27_14395, partial [Candidatus Omnitrophica bacterium]|nr:hypothetical protein [Candidatus Omnitrophota bacterium]
MQTLTFIRTKDKKSKTLKILWASMVLWGGMTVSACATTEFISTVGNGGSEDYNTVTLWEDAIDDAGNLTAADILVFSHGGVMGTVGDGASVTGQTSSATGTVIHATATQILIDGISGTFQSGEVVLVSMGNRVTISDAGDDPIVVAELYNDDGTFTENVTINDLITDASNYMIIRAATSEHHDGTAGSGVVFNPSGDGHVFTISDNYVRVEWLEMTDWTGTSSEGVRINATGIQVNHCIFHDPGNTSQQGDGVHCQTANMTFYVNNCFFYSLDRAAVLIQNANNITGYVNNCTGINLQIDPSDPGRTPGFGIDTYGTSTGMAMVIKNVYSHIEASSSSNAFQAGDGVLTGSDYNASSDATAPGTTVYTSVAANTTNFTNVTAGFEDLHLSVTSALLDKGTNLGAGMNVDIDGSTRTGTWDIGADELTTVTWDGGGVGDTNWSTAANWTDDTAPTANDVAVFDNASDNSCTIDVAVTVAGIDINSGYDGVISQGANTVTVSSFSQDAGTFTGGSTTIDVNGAFSLGAGTFTSTSGTVTIQGSFNKTGGVFTHNSGTVTFDGTTGTIDIFSDSSTFYNLTLNDAGVDATFEINGALDIDGAFTLTDGTFDLDTNDPTANFAGNVAIDGGIVAAGSGIVTFDGDLTYDDNVGTTNFGNIVIGSSPDTTDLASDFIADSLTIAVGDVLNTNGYDLDIAGAITINGTLDCTDDVETDETFINFGGNFTIASGGTFVPDQSTVIFDGNTGTVDLITLGTGSLYNLIVNDGGNSLLVEVEDPLDVNGALTITGGTLDTKSGEN